MGVSRQERFWAKVEMTDGCWLWTGAIAGTTGYGGFMWDSSPKVWMMGAHRASWLIHYEQIPNGLSVLHHCDVRRCVRPDHLFLGTYKDNYADMRAKGRERKNNGHRGKTHCKWGHEFTEENTHVYADGTRRCRQCCRVEAIRARRAKGASQRQS